MLKVSSLVADLKDISAKCTGFLHMHAVIEMEPQPVCLAPVSKNANLNCNALGHKQLPMPLHVVKMQSLISALKAELNSL